jgi:hypothetical protein
MNHGGHRRRHVPLLFSPLECAQIRGMRARGVPYKLIARTFFAGRTTLDAVIHGRGTYGWVAGGEIRCGGL